MVETMAVCGHPRPGRRWGVVGWGVVAWLGMVSVNGCRPETEGRPSEITQPRMLAFRADPAEVAPGDTVQLSALVADPLGALAAAPLDWDFCVQRKALAAPGTVAVACTTRSVDPSAVRAIGQGGPIAARVPDNACEVFGSKPPSPGPGEPALRAADPDTSGGYYQPIRAGAAEIAEGEPSIGYVRLKCGLGAVTLDQSVEYKTRYHANTNPEIEAVTIEVDGAEISLNSDESTTIPAGAAVRLRTSWSNCPLESVCGDGMCGVEETEMSCKEDCAPLRGCTGRESYIYFDPDQRNLREVRESLRISWFASNGTFERDRTGRTGEDNQDFSENTWTAPNDGGEVLLWVVIRDERGGAGWRSYRFLVE